MTVTPEDIQSLYDAEVVDSEGQKVGAVGQVYLDDDSGRPAWVTAKTGLFGLRETFVPLHGADLAVGEIRVPYTKDFIKDAPNIDGESHLDDDDQQQLFRYYRLDAPDGGPVYGQESVDVSSPPVDDLATSGSLQSHAGTGTSPTFSIPSTSSNLGAGSSPLVGVSGTDVGDAGRSTVGAGRSTVGDRGSTVGANGADAGKAGAADNAADSALVGGAAAEAGGADIDARGAGADRSGDSYTDMDVIADDGAGRTGSDGLLGNADTPAVGGAAAAEGTGADRSADLYTDRDVPDTGARATSDSDGLLGNADSPAAGGRQPTPVPGGAGRMDVRSMDPARTDTPGTGVGGSSPAGRMRIRKHQFDGQHTPAASDPEAQ
jgi:sporulation protein YlmC with PRC-barrel domain